ncbi:unnamed protein product [Prorocentrum cordatum]|uniref:ANK_REP_REGION domain-containing protein n=1 Tax=Prorocentrum cordatum TaxID=2364126 RepID=A0ABN9T5I6_9DINO|nr:unnamed protein product [Polarella glacialis]
MIGREATKLVALRAAPGGSSQLAPAAPAGGVHAAAEQGNVWWLECCGASRGCQAQLNDGDLREDTPLHRCARSGQAVACRTLLRLRADPARRNRWGLLPEHLAAHGGHGGVSALLRGARRAAGAAACSPDQRAGVGGGSRGIEPYAAEAAQLVSRHPDGLGLFDGSALEALGGRLRTAEVLRHATNLAAGRELLGPRALASAAPAPAPPSSVAGLLRGRREEDEDAAFRLAAVLSAQGLELERVPERLAPGQASPPADGSEPPRWWQSPTRDARETQTCGLLVFEPAGQVTPDALGHWVALRFEPQPPARGAADRGGAEPAAGGGGALPESAGDERGERPAREPRAREAAPGGAHAEVPAAGPAVEQPARPGGAAGIDEPVEALAAEPPREAAPFLRLDPLRGPFRLTCGEARELLVRYKAGCPDGGPQAPPRRARGAGGMVKILGEIVPDNDPRAKQAAAPGAAPRGSGQGFANRPAGIHSSPGGSGGGGAAAAPGGARAQGAGAPPAGAQPSEDLLTGDLARALGIHGRTQKADVPLVYLLVGGILAALWATGQQGVVRMMVVGAFLYLIFQKYQQAKASGNGVSLATMFGGGPGGGDGSGESDNSSSGHVIKRGPHQS